ncbi:unnamed protein product, partial [Ectocarpus sp. 13 AM-2016]
GPACWALRSQTYIRNPPPAAPPTNPKSGTSMWRQFEHNSRSYSFISGGGAQSPPQHLILHMYPAFADIKKQHPCEGTTMSTWPTQPRPSPELGPFNFSNTATPHDGVPVTAFDAADSAM